jgi:uncharacterized protein (TIGR02145 family)
MSGNSKLKLFVLCLFAGLVVACNTETGKEVGGLKAVTIGSQTWTAENLNVATFRNGDAIMETKTQEEWVKAGESSQPAWCYFNNDPANGAKYGKLYNWYAVADPRGLAPEGWHTPSDDEWTQLSNAIGGDIKAGTILKSKTGWKGNRNGTDQVGFNVVGAGGRGGTSTFNGETSVAVFWSTTSKSRSIAWYRVIHATKTGMYREMDDKMSGFSVRCVKD